MLFINLDLYNFLKYLKDNRSPDQHLENPDSISPRKADKSPNKGNKANDLNKKQTNNLKYNNSKINENNMVDEILEKNIYIKNDENNDSKIKVYKLNKFII